MMQVYVKRENSTPTLVSYIPLCVVVVCVCTGYYFIRHSLSYDVRGNNGYG